MTPKFQLITVRAPLRILIWSSGFLSCAAASIAKPIPTDRATATVIAFPFIAAPFTFKLNEHQRGADHALALRKTQLARIFHQGAPECGKRRRMTLSRSRT